MGTLYVVATPIGNLEDISFRAVRILKEAGLIAAEDTRKALRLLAAYDIHTPLESYHRHSSGGKLERLLEALESRDVALISEAGTPGISDPGQELIREAIARGFPVVPIPGPSAVITALVASGLPTDRFLYLGFLPRVRSDRRKLLASVAEAPYTLVAYEAPHRLVAALVDVHELLGNRQAAAARELTKLHEEVVRGRLSDLREHFETTSPRGEFTLVLAPPDAESAPREARPPADLGGLASSLRGQGLSPKEAVRQMMSQTGAGRRVAYAAWLAANREAVTE